MSHAPLYRRRRSKFFGLESFNRATDIKDLKRPFRRPAICQMASLPRKEDARYVGLTFACVFCCAPLMTRQTIRSRARPHKENVSNITKTTLWGNNRFTFATRLTDSFRQISLVPEYHWSQRRRRVEICPASLLKAMAKSRTRSRTEVLGVRSPRIRIGGRRLFIALTMRNG